MRKILLATLCLLAVASVAFGQTSSSSSSSSFTPVLVVFSDDCTDGSVTPTIGVQCVDNQSGLLYTCHHPELQNNTSLCDHASEWILNSVASEDAGVTTFNTRSGAVVSASGDYMASQVTVTPSGTIASTDVAAALSEVASEAQPLNSNLTSLAGKTLTGDGSLVLLGTGSFTTGNGVLIDANGNLVDSGSPPGSAALIDNQVTNQYLANMATGTVKARTTAGTGDPEDITLSSFATALDTYIATQSELDTHANATTGIHGATASPTADRIPLANGSGKLAGGWLPLPTDMALGGIYATGNCNSTTGKMVGVGTDGLPVCATDQEGGGGTLTDDQVTNQYLENMDEGTLKGRISSGTGDPEDIEIADVATMLDGYVATQSELDAHTTATTGIHGATATPTASRIPLADGSGLLAPGWLPLPTSSTKGAVLATGNCNSSTGKMIGIGTDGLPVCATDANDGGVTNTIQDVCDNGCTITSAVDVGTAFRVGSTERGLLVYSDDTNDKVILTTSDSQDIEWTLADGFAFTILDSAESPIATFDEATKTTTLSGALALSNLGVGFTASDTNPTCAAGIYNIYADASDAKLKKCQDGTTTDLDVAGGGGGGDVTAASTFDTDNVVIRSDGTGKGVKKSGIGIDNSNNLSTPGKLSTGIGGSNAGVVIFNEGTAPGAAATNTIQEYAPADVTTAYSVVKPAAPTTGFLRWTNSSGTVTESVAAIADSDIPDDLTASNYLPKSAGSGQALTGQLFLDNLGMEFEESDTNPTCSSGNFSIYADLSENKLKKCENGTPTDLDTGLNSITASSTDTLTNKTIDGEGTGNNITLVEKRALGLVRCAGTTGSLLWDTLASNIPTATCAAGTTNTAMMCGYADFPDADGDYSIQRGDTLLPTGWTGAVDVDIWWKSASTTGNVVWQVQTACRADGEVDDVAWNTASTVTDAAKGTTLQLNKATISGLTTTGCAAGESMRVRVLRNRTHASDTITGVVSLSAVEVTMRVTK